MFKLGHLDKGRLVTLTGHMSQIKASYTNANGDEVLSDWPEVVLTGVQIPTGGLGPKPNADLKSSPKNLLASSSVLTTKGSFGLLGLSAGLDPAALESSNFFENPSASLTAFLDRLSKLLKNAKEIQLSIVRECVFK